MSDRGLWPAPKKPPVDTQSVIDAVRPLIEADLRERLTTAIEDSRRPAPTTGTGLGWNQAIRHAARITADTTGDRS